MIGTHVKICGITSPEDARLSLSLGADYIGLIFAEGPRYVSTEKAIRIRNAIPQATLVGVFVSRTVGEVINISRSCGLNMVQLHGDESPQYCDLLSSKLSLPIIKAFSSSQLNDPRLIRDYKRPSFFLFDLDKKHPGENGDPSRVNGSQELLWKKANTMRREGYRIFLAGALDDSNVGTAVQRVQPYCIDVASGVEKLPGVKDRDTLRRFIQEVKC